MQITPIYEKTLEALKEGTRTIVQQGGQWSGKTVNVLGALATLCSEEECAPYKTTVTATSVPHLKGGALSDFEMYVYPSFAGAIRKYHRTDKIFTFKSGHQLEFKSFENEQAARGAKRKRLFVNEANAINPMVFFQLHSRSEQTIIDYNPSIRFFAHNDLIGQPGVRTFYSDHRDNPFLTPQKHKEIESICIFDRDLNGRIRKNDKGEPIVLKGDLELWKVYARGLTGNIEGVIFPNWEMIDDSLYPDDDECIFSIDFGYTNDPTAIMKVRLIGETLFVKELAYETGMAPISIRQVLYSNGYKKHMPLYCEHDPEMIRLLRNAGIEYAFPARKGPNSVNAGIEQLKTYHVKYTSSSKNLHRERGLYVWEKDKITGKSTNIPVDNNNHCFDATRYGVFTKYLRHELRRA